MEQDRKFNKFCQLALETDLSKEQLERVATAVYGSDEGFNNRERGSERAVVIALRRMTALEFAQRVKMAANGNATNTSDNHFGTWASD